MRKIMTTPNLLNKTLSKANAINWLFNLNNKSIQTINENKKLYKKTIDGLDH